MARFTILTGSLLALHWGALGQQAEATAETNRFQSIVVALNKGVQQSGEMDRSEASILASDAELRVGIDVLEVGAEAVWNRLRDNRSWTEMTPRLFELRSHQRIDPDVVLLDAVAVRYGSTIMKSSQPVLLVLKRLGPGWRIVQLRFAPACGAPGGLER